MEEQERTLADILWDIYLVKADIRELARMGAPTIVAIEDLEELEEEYDECLNSMIGAAHDKRERLENTHE